MPNLFSVSPRGHACLLFLCLLLLGAQRAGGDCLAQPPQGGLPTPALTQNQGVEEQDEEERRGMRRTYRKQRAAPVSAVRPMPKRPAAGQGKTQPKNSIDNGRPDSSGRQAAAAPDDAFVGFTPWQMRESSEGGERRKLVKRKGSKDVTMRPFRIKTDSLLTPGEAYLFSIESTRAGYLYIVDQEEYADGSLGEPSLIFPDNDPDTRNNRVEAGRVVEIPAQKTGDYFEAQRSASNHVGELLTVIVTPQPIIAISLIESGSYLGELKTALKIAQEKWAPNQVIKWTESVDEIGKLYTEQEGKAGGNSNSRLTEQDPLPQRLYRIKAKEEAPLIVTVRLRYDTGK